MHSMPLWIVLSCLSDLSFSFKKKIISYLTTIGQTWRSFSENVLVLVTSLSIGKTWKDLEVDLFSKQCVCVLTRLDPCRVHSRGHPGVWRQLPPQLQRSNAAAHLQHRGAHTGQSPGCCHWLCSPYGALVHSSLMHPAGARQVPLPILLWDVLVRPGALRLQPHWNLLPHAWVPEALAGHRWVAHMKLLILSQFWGKPFWSHALLDRPEEAVSCIPGQRRCRRYERGWQQRWRCRHLLFQATRGQSSHGPVRVGGHVEPSGQAGSPAVQQEVCPRRHTQCARPAHTYQGERYNEIKTLALKIPPGLRIRSCLSITWRLALVLLCEWNTHTQVGRQHRSVFLVV